MIGVRRSKVFQHRIQDGRAIISLSFYDKELSKGGQALEWVGDGYELLEELKDAIGKLETKHRV